MEIDDVIAHAVYDPTARRLRYLKTRQLKGRRKANADGHGQFGVGSRNVDSNIPVASSGHGVKANLDAAARQAESNARQVAQIRGRLSDLKAHLKELLAKKKQESTSSSSSTSSKKSAASQAPSKNGPAPPKTAKQKAASKEALKKAQQVRAQEQKKAPNNPTGGTSLTLDEQISHTRAVITDVETKLRAAIDSARTQTASNGR